MKIGIMGGTFDPIHYGHRDIALSAKAEYGLSELWFMPTGDPYCKRDKQVTPARLRLRMTELAVSELPDFCRVDDIEVMSPGRTYTAETLIKLRERYPEHEFYFIVGADSLLYMESWYKPELIFQNAVILCAGRPGNDEELDACITRLNKRYGVPGGTKVFKIHSRETAISSTEVRRLYAEGKDISDLVSPKVLSFITENGLYRTQKG